MEVFLEFVEFLNPRFVLIENVTGILSLNKGAAIRALQVALTDLGYEVRLGVLQAGNYGIAQSRWRVFLWGANKGNALPEFPEPTHLFPKKTIFGATEFKDFVVTPPSDKQTLFWDPKPTVTVGDAIRDLPAIRNGGGQDVMSYRSEPKSEFQESMRLFTSSDELFDHRTKRLGDVMLERCKAVPKNKKGAGWLDLPDHLKPKNLVRHGDNRYPNRFGRLHWDGIFNTILCEAHPYWSAVFHPSQARVLSIRECARAQGFPDHFRFYGPPTKRYEQVGNAVPPLLAEQLGLELIEAAAKRAIKTG